jgi:hypothetical protein
MADKDILLSDLNDISEIFKNNGYGGWYATIREAVAMLKEQPEIVRCKDCEHCYFASNRIPSEQNYACGKHGFDVAPDWFCADGEKKVIE